MTEEHIPFTLVLAGGGARGFAHVGVLRALEHAGLKPAGLVGVSMGAIVAATYSLRDDWYCALRSIDTSGFPSDAQGDSDEKRVGSRLRAAVGTAHTAWNMLTGWGAPDSVREAGLVVLDDLLGAKALDQGRVPVTVCATDLVSGTRVEINSGSARAAVYASSALAGLVKPVESEGKLLVDGVYSDIAPVDIARAMEAPVVIVVDAGQSSGHGVEITNGLQAVLRAMEICHLRHSDLRVDEADFVIRPVFSRAIDVLDFSLRRECMAAGVRAVRSVTADLRALLGGIESPHVAGAGAEPDALYRGSIGENHGI